MSSPYKKGDRVVVVTNYWKAAGHENKMWHPKGTAGTVLLDYSDNTVEVLWDPGRTLYIDLECIAPEYDPVSEEELAEVVELIAESVRRTP